MPLKTTPLITRSLAAATVLASTAGLTACTDGGSTADDGSVDVLIAQSTAQVPVGETAWAAALAAETGCTVNWNTIDDTAWNQQKNPSLAAGDVPDIALRAVGANDAVQYPGLFEDIALHLDDLPNVQRFFEEKPDARRLVENEKGEIHSLSSSRGSGYAGSGQHMMINRAWLDALGLEIPRTWDELTTVLEAFRTRDPNGNGQADEIPFNIRRLDTGGFGWYSPFLLLNSTGVVTSFNKGPSSQGIRVSDGEVSSFLVSEEYRRVVGYLHELLAAGLVPADALTKDDSAYYADQKGDGRNARTGLIFGWSLADFGDLRDQYVAMPAPADSASRPAQDVVWDGSDNEYEGGKLAVSAAAAGDECVWKVVDALYSEKYSIQQFTGSIPEYVTDDGDSTYTVTEAYRAAVADGRDPALADRLAGWIPDSVTLNGDWNRDDLREVDDVYAEQYSHYDHVRDVMPDYVRLSAEDATIVANNDTAVLNYAMQKTSQWIAEGGVDEEWDEYVSQLTSIGLDQNVELWQKAYDLATAAS
ncbi:extracellular solute-binding protein [Rathayibacter sp. VKM Ac-2835]|uniref:extracellular solute-binding protein n=1 Tax=Rathayibacter sp. VKM Ac-2835 TaxID=2739043 RepID=UPI00156722CD|nr:extracellular solute-binding protein [Rathayibacter sp. VKM Ac-2835]NRG39308.1 extracellular solute-binding protein [Rathayibacter sp. VKM Ac-2835]